jgi:hypothetical protein
VPSEKKKKHSYGLDVPELQDNLLQEYILASQDRGLRVTLSCYFSDFQSWMLRTVYIIDSVNKSAVGGGSRRCFAQL